MLKRGGARRLPNVPTMQLTEADCRKVIDASYAAWRAGKPFNRFITGAWEHGGIEEHDERQATADFITLMRDWHRQWKFTLTWAYVRECGPLKGSHSHILAHVPPELEPLFGIMPRRWAKTITGGAYWPGTIDTQKFYRASAEGFRSGAYEAELLGWLHYALKCAPAELEGPLGLIGCGTEPWGQSGLVHGKRTGVWQGWKRAGK